MTTPAKPRRSLGKRILFGCGIFIAVLLVLIVIVPYLIPVNPLTGTDSHTLADSDGGKFVEVMGLDTYYIERGDPNNPTVLLLHGFGGGTFNWRYQFPVLVEAGYHVIAFDRPPYGLTEKSADFDYSPENTANFTLAFMDAVGIDTAHMVGHSAGGTVIARILLSQPERVERVVFVAGAVGINGGRTGSPAGNVLSFGPLSRWAQIGARNVVSASFFSDILRNPERSPYYKMEMVTDEVVAMYMTPTQLPNWDQGFLGIFRDSGKGTPLDSQALRDITNPTLLQWGEFDTWVAPSVGETLATILPNNELIIYPDAGHMVMEEAADAVNADLIAFLGATQ
jgi:pimeloyl-ACP methyl ester carboxylesterase